MDSGSSNEYVLVPVPKDRVLDVMAFLTKDLGGANPPIADHVPQPDYEGDLGRQSESAAEWDDESLRELLLEPSTPSKQVLVLEHLASRAGEWVTAAELQAALADALSAKYPGRALGAVMRALGLRSNYWERGKPFEVDWRDGVNKYRMPGRYAAPVLKAVAERRADGEL